jgi:hypothetical protein
MRAKRTVNLCVHRVGDPQCPVLDEGGHACLRRPRPELYDSANWPDYAPSHWPTFTPPLTPRRVRAVQSHAAPVVGQFEKLGQVWRRDRRLVSSNTRPGTTLKVTASIYGTINREPKCRTVSQQQRSITSRWLIYPYVLFSMLPSFCMFRVSRRFWH